MRVLGLDLGSKRIGLALSDLEASLAFPAGTLRSRGRKADIKALCDLILEKEVGHVVVGHPRHMDGPRSVQDAAAANLLWGFLGSLYGPYHDLSLIHPGHCIRKH